jgi:hypothetical protein
MTIREALLGPFQRPALWLETWNWKTAVTSSGIRASIFFVANLPAGFDAAVAALQTELVYRAITSGFYGGLTERLARATPARAATIAALLVLPATAHAIELAVHLVAGTAVLGASVGGSLAFSVVSTRFNLFAMQRGVLTIGRGRQSLRRDVCDLPFVVAGFVWWAVRPTVRVICSWRPRQASSSCPSEPSI